MPSSSSGSWSVVRVVPASSRMLAGQCPPPPPLSPPSSSLDCYFTQSILSTTAYIVHRCSNSMEIDCMRRTLEAMSHRGYPLTKKPVSSGDTLSVSTQQSPHAVTTAVLDACRGTMFHPQTIHSVCIVVSALSQARASSRSGTLLFGRHDYFSLLHRAQWAMQMNGFLAVHVPNV